MADTTGNAPRCTFIRPVSDPITGKYLRCERPATELVKYEPLSPRPAYTAPRCARHAHADARRQWYGYTTRGLPLHEEAVDRGE